MAKRTTPTDDLRIEFPAHGATYTHQRYGVYRYSEYPASSVLAGQEMRERMGTFKTLAEAQAAYPTAVVVEGSGYHPPYLGHLPDEGDD